MATNFFKRWSERKLTDSHQENAVELDQAKNTETEVEQDPFGEVLHHEADSEETTQEQNLSLSDVESINGDSSVSAFLAKGVEKEVKKAALRKMFLSDEFNVVDGLNDYDHDYSAVKTLGSDVAEGLRNWVKETSSESELESEQTIRPVNEFDDENAPANCEEALVLSDSEVGLDTASNQPKESDELPLLDHETKKTT
ncbi:DUF3306 domain-containing protein [Vibrio sp. Of7-15]|uniref:DUF3306 domain-containing protein n=1 Tax=Vibrio sp. Of7-15 TaxID=2724879 RepID=UPI001EF28399|nr:DUF3306 domain-containing protein [Vibrio sp. Of7-15]